MQHRRYAAAARLARGAVIGLMGAGAIGTAVVIAAVGLIVAFAMLE